MTLKQLLKEKAKLTKRLEKIDELLQNEQEKCKHVWEDVCTDYEDGIVYMIRCKKCDEDDISRCDAETCNKEKYGWPD